MADTVPYVRVYVVSLCLSDCKGATLDASPDSFGYMAGGMHDDEWIYGEWADASSRIRRVIDAAPAEAVVLVQAEMMPADEYAALPPDAD